MLVVIRPCCIWWIHAASPAAIASTRNATHVQYHAFPRSTMRKLPTTNSPNARSDLTRAPPSQAVEVEETRPRVELVLEHEHALVLEDVADLAVRIAQVPELARTDRTNLDARRIAPVPHAL